MDDQGDGSFECSKMPFLEGGCLGKGVAEGVLVYAGAGSSIDSQGRCVGSEGSAGTEVSPAKNHLFPTVSVVVAVETEVDVDVAVYVEKTVVVTGFGVTKLASFKTAFSFSMSPILEWRYDAYATANITGMAHIANLTNFETASLLVLGLGEGSMRSRGCWLSGDILTAACG